jgi:hypothetical protein
VKPGWQRFESVGASLRDEAKAVTHSRAALDFLFQILLRRGIDEKGNGYHLVLNRVCHEGRKKMGAAVRFRLPVEDS